jgi:hypothetical protein
MTISQQEQADGSYKISMTSNIGQHTDAQVMSLSHTQTPSHAHTLSHTHPHTHSLTQIERVFIQCKTFFHVPKVQYVEIFGHTANGKDAYEKITP